MVDDEPVVINLVCRILERAGIQTIRALNAHEALARCEELKDELDIVISDVSMPGFTGVELGRCIARSEYPVPVILMSGCVRTDPVIENVRHTARLEEFNFLQKPFRPKELLEEVSLILGEPIVPLSSDCSISPTYE